jgi:hypothetical protein
MVLMYAVTTPIGIAVGIAVSTTFVPDSVAAMAVQGALNGVSGGMLLYISMCAPPPRARARGLSGEARPGAWGSGRGAAAALARRPQAARGPERGGRAPPPPKPALSPPSATPSAGPRPPPVATHALQTAATAAQPPPNRRPPRYQLIAEEFSRDDLVVRPRLRAAMTAGLLMGAACMCVIAIWS